MEIILILENQLLYTQEKINHYISLIIKTIDMIGINKALFTETRQEKSSSRQMNKALCKILSVS